MVDVESSGLDPRRDALVSIAGIALRMDWRRTRLEIVLGDSFQVVIRQASPSSRENILVHGIGEGRQAQGMPAADALRAFQAFAGDAPLLAFHAAFDAGLLARYASAELKPAPVFRWLDVAHLCEAAHPEVKARSLDEWLRHFGLQCLARHDAAADALVQSELLLRLWPRLAAECRSWRDLEKFAAGRRWLGRP